MLRPQPFVAVSLGALVSVTFSNGAHDEWNIFRQLNERRRADAKYGVANQIPMMFDGTSVAPAATGQAIAAGVSGACKI